MNLTQNLSHLYQTRRQISDRLTKIATVIDSSSLDLQLELELADLHRTAKNLRDGVFRLLVLGDLKRGKSTFLNALLGERILPSDVNPCTALLTVIRYGETKQAIVYFKDNRAPEQIELDTFKQQYTINPDEAKKLEQTKVLAFPEVENDTEARNKLSLEYVYNCQAVLFMLRAVQPLTLDERRYLENYIKDRGLATFFLLNGWDEIRQGLVNLDSQEELASAESKVRQVFQTNLMEYCQVEEQNLYRERVFEISAINALRQRLKNPDLDLSNTGFGQFSAALENFLTTKRANTEFNQAKLIAKCDRLEEFVSRRIPLLQENMATLKQKLDSVQPEFEQLKEIKHEFASEVIRTRDKQAKSIANSFQSYILKLGDTFETDFVTYQPSLEFFDFLRQEKREEFNRAFKQAFERYVQDKLARWELIAEKELELAFLQLAESAAEKGSNYRQVVNSIDEKLIGNQILIDANSPEENSPGWAKWAMGFFSLATGNVAGVALAAVGFNWKNILVNWLAVIGISSFLVIFTGISLVTPLGIALTSLGIGAIQTNYARDELIKATKKEFVKTLPAIAQEQKDIIRDTIEECFDNYNREVTKRIDEDIKARKAELNNLTEQRDTFDRTEEVKSLQTLNRKVAATYQEIISLVQ